MLGLRRRVAKNEQHGTKFGAKCLKIAIFRLERSERSIFLFGAVRATIAICFLGDPSPLQFLRAIIPPRTYACLMPESKSAAKELLNFQKMANYVVGSFSAELVLVLNQFSN